MGPTTALQSAWLELQQLYNSNIIHCLVDGKRAPRGVSAGYDMYIYGSANGARPGSSQDKGKRKARRNNLNPKVLLYAARNLSNSACLHLEMEMACSSLVLPKVFEAPWQLPCPQLHPQRLPFLCQPCGCMVLLLISCCSASWTDSEAVAVAVAGSQQVPGLPHLRAEGRVDICRACAQQ